MIKLKFANTYVDIHISDVNSLYEQKSSVSHFASNIILFTLSLLGKREIWILHISIDVSHFADDRSIAVEETVVCSYFDLMCPADCIFRKREYVSVRCRLVSVWFDKAVRKSVFLNKESSSFEANGSEAW